MVIDSKLSIASLTDVLRRATARGETNRIPDPLRREWVDHLRFDVDEEGVYHIIATGMRGSAGGRGITSIDVEVELRLLPPNEQSASSRLDVAVGPTTSTWIGMITPPAVFAALGVIQVVQFGDFGFGLWACVAFSLATVLINWLRASSVVARAWPGFLVEVQKVADGTLYVPAA